MESKNFKFNFSLFTQPLIDENNENASINQNENFNLNPNINDKSLNIQIETLSSNLENNENIILSYKLDTNEIFKIFFQENRSDSKLKDLFWNRIIIKDLNNTEFSEEDYFKCLDIFFSEFSIFIKMKDYNLMIESLRYFYSICTNIYTLFNSEKKSFVSKFMKKISSFYQTFINGLSELYEAIDQKNPNLNSKEILITPFGQFLRLFTGILFMNARCGYSKRILDLMTPHKSDIIKPNGKNMFGAGTGLQWTWGLVYIACLECAGDSVLPQVQQLNLLEWTIEKFTRNVDTIPYISSVFFSMKYLLKNLSARSIRFIMELYINCSEYKVYLLPIFNCLFCDSEYRAFHLDSDEYFFKWKEITIPEHVSKFIQHLNYYDACDSELLINIFKSNRILYIWYWMNSPNMQNILIGSRKGHLTPTSVARLNFLCNLIKISLSKLPTSITLESLKEFCQFSISHPTWKTKNFGERLFLFPSQDDPKRRVSIRIAALSVLHALFEKYQSLETLIAKTFGSNEFNEITRKEILNNFIFPFDDFLKMVSSPFFLFMWPVKVDMITFRPRTYAYQYVAALALKLLPYYKKYYPQSENTYHYDLLVSSIPLNTFSVRIWSEILSNTTVPLGWERVEIAHASNYIMYTVPFWESSNLFMDRGMKFASKNVAEIYFWNRNLYHPYVPRYYNFFTLDFTKAIKEKSTIEKTKFNKSEHALKFAIINTLKSILSVSNKNETLDLLSRMTREINQYPEIEMFLSKPVQQPKIDPSKSKFQIESLVSSNRYDYLARLCHVPLFDIAAKLPEIYKFSKSLQNMELFWRASLDLSHVISIFDLSYLHGWPILLEMIKDLSFNILLIQVSRTFNQISLFDNASSELISSCISSLSKEPSYMLPFYSTQALKGLVKCHNLGINFYHCILQHILNTTKKFINDKLEFDRCFTDVDMLESLLCRSATTASIVLNFLYSILKMDKIYHKSTLNNLENILYKIKKYIPKPQIQLLKQLIKFEIKNENQLIDQEIQNSSFKEDLDLIFHTNSFTEISNLKDQPNFKKNENLDLEIIKYQTKLDEYFKLFDESSSESSNEEIEFNKSSNINNKLIHNYLSESSYENEQSDLDNINTDSDSDIEFQSDEDKISSIDESNTINKISLKRTERDFNYDFENKKNKKMKIQ